jgi:hypothetical protein
MFVNTTSVMSISFAVSDVEDSDELQPANVRVRQLATANNRKYPTTPKSNSFAV